MAEMGFATITQWANGNQGVIALGVVFLGMLRWIYGCLSKNRPSRAERCSTLKREIAHAEAMKKEVESHVEWSDFSFYGQMQIRDAAQAVPDSEETHSSAESPYGIATLVGIHNEHLALLTDFRGVESIKEIAGFWHYADESDEDAITVETLVWINYRDIECFRWETNWYWEWPQVCCRFADPKRFPVSNILFVQRVQGTQKPYFRTICSKKDVTKMPSALSAVA